MYGSNSAAPIWSNLTARAGLGGEVDGVLATHVIFPAAKVVKIPDHLSWSEASILPCAGLTSWSALHPEGFQLAGRTILVQGEKVIG